MFVVNLTMTDRFSSRVGKRLKQRDYAGKKLFSYDIENIILRISKLKTET